MKVIISYILNMMPYMLISIPMFILVRYLIFRKTKIINLKREILLLIFYLFLIGLFSQTIIPKFDSNNNLIVSKVRLNLIPFRIFFDTIIELKKGNIYYLIISLLGNIVMFIPIGFFIKLLYRYNDKKIVLIGFLISLSIEFIQIFTGRETDIDDLILNILGVYIGVIILKKIKKLLTSKLGTEVKMKKEEILEKARKENKQKDLACIEAENKAVKIAAIAMVFLATIYYALGIILFLKLMIFINFFSLLIDLNFKKCNNNYIRNNNGR